MYYDNLVISSYNEWLNYHLVHNRSLYVEKSGVSLFQYTDEQDPAKTYYASPYAQWVHQTGNSIGLPVIYDNGVPETLGTGMNVDFINGRAYFDAAPTGPITADFTDKDYNIYIDNGPDNEFILEDNYLFKPVLNAEAAMKPHRQIMPAIFIRVDNTENTPKCLGGKNETNIVIRNLVVSKSSFDQARIEGILRDTMNCIFPLLTCDELPLGARASLKDTSYNYTSYLSNIPADELIKITKVRVFSFENSFFNKNYPRAKLSIVESTLSQCRISNI